MLHVSFKQTWSKPRKFLKQNQMVIYVRLELSWLKVVHVRDVIRSKTQSPHENQRLIQMINDLKQQDFHKMDSLENV